MRRSPRETKASAGWRAMLEAFTSVRELLAHEMEAEAGLSLERYEILLMLAESESGALRPSELADRRRLSRSGATRMIDRLERDGLVERRDCGGDGRGSEVALTPAGEQAFLAAGRIHMQGIERYVGTPLSDAELDELVRLMELVTSISQDRPEP